MQVVPIELKDMRKRAEHFRQLGTTARDRETVRIFWTYLGTLRPKLRRRRICAENAQLAARASRHVPPDDRGGRSVDIRPTVIRVTSCIMQLDKKVTMAKQPPSYTTRRIFLFDGIDTRHSIADSGITTGRRRRAGSLR